MKNRPYVRDVFRNIGARSILAALIVFLLTVAATFVGGIQLYNSTKESIVLQGEVNAQQSAMSFDRYLLVRKNTVLLAGNVLNNMLTEDQPVSEILHYLTTESQSIKDSIDKDYTGLYGWVKGQYVDGVGWVPDEDYIPTERPWYCGNHVGRQRNYLCQPLSGCTNSHHHDDLGHTVERWGQRAGVGHLIGADTGNHRGNCQPDAEQLLLCAQ